MSRRCQILQRKPVERGQERNAWQFAAHGARWTEEEAAAHIALLEEHGWQVKRIPV